MPIACRNSPSTTTKRVNDVQRIRIDGATVSSVSSSTIEIGPDVPPSMPGTADAADSTNPIGFSRSPAPRGVACAKMDTIAIDIRWSGSLDGDGDA